MQEIELKFQIPPRGRDALASTVDEDGAVRAVRLQARYFDTAARDLAGAAFALRLRREDEGWVQTLKGRGDGMMRRLEHNAPVDLPPRAGADAVPALSLGRHPGTPAGLALAALPAGAATALMSLGALAKKPDDRDALETAFAQYCPQ